MAVRDRHSSRVWPGCSLSGCGPKPVRFSAGRLKCCSRLSRLSQEMAVRDRHSSRVWPGCSLSGCGPKPVRFFCRSSEMLLASLAAITRNGCARSAFQPHLAGVFAFWVRTKTCPLFSAGRLKCCSRLSWLSQEMAVRDRHSSRIWPGCSLSGCGPKPVRFLPSGGILSVHELIPRSE